MNSHGLQCLDIKAEKVPSISFAYFTVFFLLKISLNYPKSLSKKEWSFVNVFRNALKGSTHLPFSNEFQLVHVGEQKVIVVCMSTASSSASPSKMALKSQGESQ